jgi:hypothetical protein
MTNNNNLKTTSSVICACTTHPLTVKDAHAFSNAIKKKWYYKWHIDDLPAWGMVGELLFQNSSDDAIAHAHVYTERTIRITVQHDHENNNDKEAASAENIALNIVRVDLVSSTESQTKVEAGNALVFTTKNKWHLYYNNPHRGNANGNRADRYLDYSFFQDEVRCVLIYYTAGMAFGLVIIVCFIVKESRKERTYICAVVSPNARSSNTYASNQEMEEGRTVLST